ncbi:dihydrofolate reductase [Sandaracinus amylolyticus]
MIAAVARNGVIGRDNALPWRLPDDLKRFKQLTSGKPVVMGRKTYESIGRPLANRTNLVLTRGHAPIEGCVVVGSIDEALAAVRDERELWVIGGEAVYAAFLPRADVLELTEVDADVEGDARFPSFSRDAWRVVSDVAHPVDAKHALPFRFVTYERVR